MAVQKRKLELSFHEQPYTQFWNSFPKGIHVQKTGSLEYSQKATAKIM